MELANKIYNFEYRNDDDDYPAEQVEVKLKRIFIIHSKKKLFFKILD